MSFHQIQQDESRLKNNNAAVRRLAKEIPGSTVSRIGRDQDTGTGVYALNVDGVRIEFDYLNYEGDGFCLTFFTPVYSGCKECVSEKGLLGLLRCMFVGRAEWPTEPEAKAEAIKRYLEVQKVIESRVKSYSQPATTEGKGDE